MKTLRVRRAISGFLGDDEARVERVLELVENQSKNLQLGVYPPHYFLGWRYRLDVVEAEGAGCIVLRGCGRRPDHAARRT
ncbi:MAG TPA: hypothetical protein VK458_29245 [Myxococcaceae bacterium]|nr:hypothetical protein [Myxococcaceae bacterium]